MFFVKIKNLFSCRTKGSLTVEAVFVVPVCLFVCFFLMGSLFYLHHSSYYCLAAWECVLTGLDEGPDQESIKERWQLLKAAESLPVGSVKESDEKSKKRVTVTVKGGTISFFGFSKQTFFATAKRSINEPAAFIRKAKAAKSIVK